MSKLQFAKKFAKMQLEKNILKFEQKITQNKIIKLPKINIESRGFNMIKFLILFMVIFEYVIFTLY